LSLTVSWRGFTALELRIYNLQKQTSESGKEYTGRVLAFAPGQRGAIPAAAETAPFYVRDQRNGKQWIRLDARTLAEAKIEAEKIQHRLEARAKGVEVVEASDANQERLTVRIAHYLNEVEANKSVSTWRLYHRSLELFKESCRRLNVQDVNREDMLAFKTFLKRKGFESRSVYNHFLNVTVFFAAVKGRNSLGLKEADWPPKTERLVEEYDLDELQKLIKTAATTFQGMDRNSGRYKGTKKDDRLLLNAFLNTGMRNGELAHLTYADIDARHSLWTVKPTEGHKLKTEKAQRQVPVGEWLTKKVMEQKAAEGKKDSDLVFPAPVGGGVNKHLLNIVKRVAELAGVTGRVDMHKFRATAITTWLRAGNTPQDIREWVGHEDPGMLDRYVAKLKLQDQKARAKATDPFNSYATMGD
jgi:integrase